MLCLLAAGVHLGGEEQYRDREGGGGCAGQEVLGNVGQEPDGNQGTAGFAVSNSKLVMLQFAYKFGTILREVHWDLEDCGDV